MAQAQRNTITIGTGEFSYSPVVGQAVFARLFQNAFPHFKSLGIKKPDAGDTAAWLKAVLDVLEELPYDGTLILLRTLLRPENGVDIEDAWSEDTENKAVEVISFFTERLKALLPASPNSAPIGGTKPRKARARKT